MKVFSLKGHDIRVGLLCGGITLLLLSFLAIFSGGVGNIPLLKWILTIGFRISSKLFGFSPEGGDARFLITGTMIDWALYSLVFVAGRNLSFDRLSRNQIPEEVCGQTEPPSARRESSLFKSLRIGFLIAAITVSLAASAGDLNRTGLWLGLWLLEDPPKNVLPPPIGFALLIALDGLIYSMFVYFLIVVFRKIRIHTQE